MSDWQFNLRRRNILGGAGGIGALIVLILFATPFAGFGVVALVAGLRQLASGDVKNGLAGCGFGLLFAGVGFGLVIGAVVAWKRAKAAAELAVRFADQPWKLRPDWAAGKIPSTGLSQSIVLLVVGLMFSGIGIPVSISALADELPRRNYLALLILLFPLIGIGLLAAFVRGYWSLHRFGCCFFELGQVPIPPGGVLSGLIQTEKPVRAEHGLHLKLACLRREITESSDDRNAHESVLWQEGKVLRADAAVSGAGPGLSAIPVYFTLPADQPESSQGTVSVCWRLEAHARMRGPDFVAGFDLPVFKVAGTTGVAAKVADPTASLQMPKELRRDLHSKIQVTDGPTGREFNFPAARNPGAALAFPSRIPIVFPIFGCVFGLILSYFAASLWFKKRGSRSIRPV